MIIESGSALEFKRCMIASLPWMPHENEMWRMKNRGSSVAVVIMVKPQEVILRVEQQNFLTRMSMDDFMDWQEKGQLVLTEQRAVSRWESLT